MSEDAQQIIQDFKQAVNMSPKQLRDWLETEESQQVGQKDGSDESIGHKSGERIVKLLEHQADYSEDDLAHMRKVVSYVRRHSAQRPHGEIEDSRWRFSLMNWGHDPLED